MITPTIKDIRAAAANRRKKRQRNRRLLLGSAVGAVVMLGLLWLGLPGILRSQLEERGAELLERPVRVERVSFNPFTLTVEITGLAIGDRDGGELLSWRRLMVNVNLWQTLSGNWGVDALELDGLRGRLFLTAAGELNIADLLEKFSAEGSTEAARPWEVARLSVVDAQIYWADASRSRPFASTIGPLSFSVSDFHTKFDPEAPYQFEASTETGETLRWRGTLSVVPLKSMGDFVLEGIDLPKYDAYYADLIPFEIESGLVSASGSYELAWPQESPELKLKGGAARFSDIALATRANPGELQTLAKLELHGIEADLSAGQYGIESITLQEGALDLRRSGAGGDWMGITLWGGEAATTAAAAPTVDLPAVTVGLLQLEGMQLRLQDDTLVDAAPIGVRLDSVVLADLHLADLSAPLGVQVRASFPLGGALEISGTARVRPWSSDLAISLTEFSLLAGADHVRGLTGLALVSGTVDLAGRLGGEDGATGFEGTSMVKDLSLLDGQGAPLAGFGELALKGIDLQLDPTALTVAEVTLVAPTAHANIAADGTLNLSAIAGRLTEAKPAVAPAGEGTAMPELEIGHITVEGGRLALRDASVPKVATLSVDEFAGVLQGWSSRDVARAEVALSGKVNGISPFRIVGDLNPLGRPAHADLEIAVERVDLQPTGGYVDKFAGFELDDGKLSLDIDFHLRDQAIESETRTVLDQFTLGAQTNSPDAVNLPVKLGVALLKDPAGEIVIDVPVAGRLDDPEFRIGRVVWRVILNLLTKAATSPFALLGGVVGGDQEVDLEHHWFEPGQGSLTPETRESLAAIQRALTARPELNIGIRGEYDPALDPAALRPVVLENMLRERGASGDGDDSGAAPPGARETALVTLYEELFGVPPVDPHGELPAVDVPAAEPPPPPTETGGPDEEGATLLAWLRRVFQPAAAEDSPAASTEFPPAPGSFPLPAGIEPELPVLPMAEIEARLLERIEVPEAALIALAQDRAEGVREHLRAAGLADERMTRVDPLRGKTQVTLDLR